MCLPLPWGCRYEGFEVQYKNDFKMLATDYALALTAVLGQPRAEGVTAQEAFRCVGCLPGVHVTAACLLVTVLTTTIMLLGQTLGRLHGVVVDLVSGQTKH
jgi:hypothetical protein